MLDGVRSKAVKFLMNQPVTLTEGNFKGCAVGLLKEAKSRAPSPGKVAKKTGSIALTVGKKTGNVGLRILGGDAKNLPTINREDFKNLSEDQKQQYKRMNKTLNSGVFM